MESGSRFLSPGGRVRRTTTEFSETQFGRENRRRRRKSSCSWSDLYPEIIQAISRHLKTRFDILSFRGVCKKWREHSVALSPNILSPLLPHRFLTASGNRPPCHFFDYLRRIGHCELNLVFKSIYLITPFFLNNEAFSTGPSSWIVWATEPQPGKIELFHPLSGAYLEYLPKALDLTRFQVSELAQGYQLQYAIYGSKVVLCSSSTSPGPVSMSDCAAIVLYRQGFVGALRLSGRGDSRGYPEWSKPRRRDHIRYRKLDDIVSFKGIHVAVDPHGRLFSMEYEAQNSKPLVVTDVLAGDLICDNKGRMKRLVVDPLSDKLYLLEMEYQYPSELQFNVYEFNEECKKWDKVEALCHYRALFVGVSHCFFAPAPVGCLANCIVFYSGCFHQYKSDRISYDHLWEKQKVKDRIGVYHLGKQRFSYISDYPEMLQMMQPPAAWFSSSEREPMEDEELQADLSRQEDPCLHEEVSPPSLGPESREETAENPSISPAHDDLTETPTMNDDVEHVADVEGNYDDDVEHVADVEASDPETPMEEITHSTSTSFVASLTQCDKSDATVKFKGLDIKSSLVPTLQSIWLNHGNIIENSIIHNSDLIARALELLANVVLILEGNSARSLDDSQADYLSSTLSDLRSMRFKVDWLIPIVEKALALHKNKALLDSLNRIRQSKARVEEIRLKYIDEVAKLDEMLKEFDENMATVLKMIPFPGEVDLDQPLRRGLT